MSSNFSKPWVTICLFLFSSFVAIGILELYCRIFVITKSPLITVNKGVTPSFRLTRSIPWSPRSTVGVKPESERGNRPAKIALVGDSVTYCVNVPTQKCFSELLQEMQTQFDIYNFGVPGYGIPEIKELVLELSKTREFQYVFYIYNSNDIFDAMPVLLSMAVDPAKRFASIYDYNQDFKAKLKRKLLDKFKSPFVLHYYVAPYLQQLGTTKSVTQAPTLPANVENSSLGSSSSKDCYEKFKQELISSWSYKRQWRAMERMYEDEGIQSKISQEIRAMSQSAKAEDTYFWVIPVYDFAFFLEEHRTLHDIIRKSLSRSAYTVDLYDSFAAHAHHCDVYTSDLSHLDIKGNELFANSLFSYLENVKVVSGS